jgi:hypothetical protein
MAQSTKSKTNPRDNRTRIKKKDRDMLGGISQIVQVIDHGTGLNTVIKI